MLFINLLKNAMMIGWVPVPVVERYQLFCELYQQTMNTKVMISLKESKVKILNLMKKYFGFIPAWSYFRMSAGHRGEDFSFWVWLGWQFCLAIINGIKCKWIILAPGFLTQLHRFVNGKWVTIWQNALQNLHSTFWT